MPVGCLLINIGSPQQGLLVKGASSKLQSDGKIVIGKTTGYGDCREANEVEGTGVL
jgi:hypothetical protein